MPLKDPVARKAYDKARAYRTWIHNWRRKGIVFSLEDRRLLWEKQGGKCAVCKRPESDFRQVLAVDHDHKTGKVRGLVCKNCNSFVLVTVERFDNLIEDARRYLKNYESFGHYKTS